MGHRRTAFVTGGARRVGRAVVLRLAEAGFDIAFSTRQLSAAAQQTADDARHFGVNAAVVVGDLRHDQPASLVQQVLAVLGRLDVLVNNAAVFLPDDTPHGPSAALQREAFDVNCGAPTSLMRESALALRQSKGCVVNFLDLLADRPWPRYSAYCASKAALRAQTLAFARRLAPDVRVNGIAPGVIAWPDDMPEQERDAYLRRVPLARAGTPEEAADAVLWLVTAADYVTGQVIGLDGGRSLLG